MVKFGPVFVNSMNSMTFVQKCMKAMEDTIKRYLTIIMPLKIFTTSQMDTLVKAEHYFIAAEL